jgi:hypothetical protein
MSGIGGSLQRNDDHHWAVVCLYAAMGRVDSPNYEERAGEITSFIRGLSSPTPVSGAQPG